jgi:hypothetical protein
MLERKENPRMNLEGSGVTVGLDAAVVANHHVIVRHPSPFGPGEVVANLVAVLQAVFAEFLVAALPHVEALSGDPE